MSILTLEDLEHMPEEQQKPQTSGKKAVYVAGFFALAILAFMVGLSLARIFGNPEPSTTNASTGIEPRGPAATTSRP